MPLFGPPGERLGYEVYGSGPPLVLLHGFTASSASFLSNIPELSEHFTVVAVDLLGHGASDAPEDVGLYGPEAAVERLGALFDHLGFEAVLLCGHSLGGALALRFALDAPDRLAGLVVINSNSAAGPPEWRDGAQANLTRMASRVREEGTEVLRDSRLYPARSTRLPIAAREQLIADFDRLQPAGVAGTAEGLVAKVNAFERIPELSIATLIVAGDRDAEFMKNLPAFYERIPDGLARVATLEGAGHSANLEQPDEFNSALLQFARDIDYLPPFPPLAAVATPSGPRLSVLMTVGGIGLVAIGFGFLAAAALVGRDDSDPQAAPVPTEIVEDVAGENTQAVASPTGADASPTTPSATASATTEAASPTPGQADPLVAPVDEEDDEPGPTAQPTSIPPNPTQPPPTATAPPTQVPPPTATPVPAGQYAAISGPTSLAVGQFGSWLDASSVTGTIITRTWSPGGGQNPQYATSFGAPGCYSIGLTIVVTGGLQLSTGITVSVGGATC